ncbi:MAG: Calx-beta domain-containing protein, partial [Oceanococcus sp.]
MLSGIALKGPFQAGADVYFEQVDGGGRVQGVLDDASNYAKRISWRGYTKVRVVGIAYNETDAAYETTPLELSAVFNVQGNITLNVNLLTSLVEQRFSILVGDGLNCSSAFSQARDEVMELFGLLGEEPTLLSFVDASSGSDAANSALASISFSGSRLTRDTISKALVDKLAVFFDEVQSYLAALSESAKMSNGLPRFKQAMLKRPVRRLIGVLDDQACQDAFDDMRGRFPNRRVISPCENGVLDADWPGLRHFAVFAPAFVEGDENKQLEITGVLVPPPVADMEIPFRLQAGSAQPESDYVDVSGVFEFKAGNDEATIFIETVGDKTPESDESFQLLIEATRGVSVPRPIIDIVLINDDGQTRSAKAESFAIEQFTLAEITDADGQALVDPLGASEDINAPINLGYSIAFAVDCEPGADPRLRPCSNERPTFSLELLLSNGLEALLAEQITITPQQVNYRNTPGLDSTVLEGVMLVEQALLDELLAQGGLDGLTVVAKAHVDDGHSDTQIEKLLGPRLLPKFTELSFAGDIALVESVAFSTSCENDGVLVSGNGAIGDVQFNFSNVCVRLSTLPPLMEVVSGSVLLGSAQYESGGLAVQLGDVELDAQGAQAASVLLQLPLGVSVHNGDDFQSFGRSVVDFGSASLNNGLQVSNDEISETVWLASEGLPLVFKLDRLSLTADGLDGRVVDVKYLHHLRDFAENDPRQRILQREDLAWDLGSPRNYLHSNDSRWGLPRARVDDQFGGNESLHIDANGLDVAGLGFSAGSAGAHFPSAVRRWGGFTANVVGGRLMTVNQGASNQLSARITPRSTCGECTANAGDPDSLGVQFAAWGEGANGAFAGRGPLLGLTRWGPLYEGKRVFERDDRDRESVYYQPGYVLPGSAQMDHLAEALLASADVVEFDQLLIRNLFPLSHRQTVAGNGFMPGLNVGPQNWRDEQNQPELGIGADLSSTITAISIADDVGRSQVSLRSNAGSKYVVRAAGVTGVFHGDAPEPTTVYGYPVKFERFAFRVQDNQLDPYTWIDGEIYVPEGAGLNLAVESLSLKCDGAIDGGVLGAGFCSLPQAGPNCGLELVAWNARTEVLSLRFEDDLQNPPEHACAASARLLTLDQVVDVAALNKPLLLTAQWTPEGELSNGQIRGASQNTLDAGSRHAGFPVSLGASISMPLGQGDAASEAWFQFDEAAVAVPFWSALKSQMRLGNASLSSALPSVLSATSDAAGLDLPANLRNSALSNALAGESNELTQAQQQNFQVKAEYTWGATGFDLSLPVFYGSAYGFGEAGPQWLGVKDTESLLVLELSSGIDYIRPDLTQISFGASADLAKLRKLNLDFNVDLLDPESIAR